MALYTWPDWLLPQSSSLVEQHAQSVSQGVFGSGDQVITHPGSRWGWDFDFGAQPLADRVRTEAFLTRLTGMQHHTNLTDWQLSTPAGTIRMQGVTTRSPVAQWATTLPLTGCGVTATLLAGDWLEVFGQLFRCVQDATATAAGHMDVQVRHMARTAIAAGTPVILDSPVARYGMADSTLNLPRAHGDIQPPFAARFIERFP